MTLGIDQDYLVIDNTESVTVTEKRNESATVHKVSDALREPIRTQSSGGEWLISDKQCFWNVWTYQLPEDVLPKIRDVITTSDGESWTIMDVTLETFDTRVRMLSEKER